MLFNNQNSGEQFLHHTINNLGWTDTVFIFGYSNGRDSYITKYLDTINENSTPQNTLVFFGSDFLNIHLEAFKTEISNLDLLGDWINNTLISE